MGRHRMDLGETTQALGRRIRIGAVRSRHVRGMLSPFHAAAWRTSVAPAPVDGCRICGRHAGMLPPQVRHVWVGTAKRGMRAADRAARTVLVVSRRSRRVVLTRRHGVRASRVHRLTLGRRSAVTGTVMRRRNHVGPEHLVGGTVHIRRCRRPLHTRVMAPCRSMRWVSSMV